MKTFYVSRQISPLGQESRSQRLALDPTRFGCLPFVWRLRIAVAVDRSLWLGFGSGGYPTRCCSPEHPARSHGPSLVSRLPAFWTFDRTRVDPLMGHKIALEATKERVLHSKCKRLPPRPTGSADERN